MSGTLKADASNLLGLWRGYRYDDKTGWLLMVKDILQFDHHWVDNNDGISLPISVNVFVELEAICLHWPGASPFPYAITFTPEELYPHPMNPMAKGLSIHIKGYRWELYAHAHSNKPATMVIKGQVALKGFYTARTVIGEIDFTALPYV